MPPCLLALVVLVEIYPREGTETSILQRSYLFMIVEIYPREGTETKMPDRN